MLFQLVDHILVLQAFQILLEPGVLLLGEAALAQVDGETRKVRRSRFSALRRGVRIVPPQLALLDDGPHRRCDGERLLKAVVISCRQIVQEVEYNRAGIPAVGKQSRVEAQSIGFRNADKLFAIDQSVELRIVLDAWDARFIDHLVFAQQGLMRALQQRVPEGQPAPPRGARRRPARSLAADSTALDTLRRNACRRRSVVGGHRTARNRKRKRPGRSRSVRHRDRQCQTQDPIYQTPLPVQPRLTITTGRFYFRPAGCQYNQLGSFSKDLDRVTTFVPPALYFRDLPGFQFAKCGLQAENRSNATLSAIEAGHQS